MSVVHLYSPDDFDHLIVPEERMSEGEPYQPGELVLTPDANPPIEKMDALFHNVPEFRKTWRHERALPSNSEYEASLAKYAVMALWTDQEIANLVIAHRRKWEIEKIDKVTKRRDYVAGIISLVRGEKDRATAIQSLAERIDEAPRMEDPPPDDQKPEDARKIELVKLSSIFGVKVVDWIQVGRDKPTYTIVLEVDGEQKEVAIGDVQAVFDSEKVFARMIFAQASLVMEKVGNKAWPGICRILARVVRFVEAPEAQDVESVKAAVRAFLKRAELYSADQKDLACREEKPFLSDGEIYISIHNFRKWLRGHWHDQWDAGPLLNYLRMMGFRQEAVNYYKADGKRAARRYWTVKAEGLYEHDSRD